MIKRILLPLDPSPYTLSATEYAIHVAQKHQAEITGLAVLDIPGIEKSEGAIPIGGIHYAEQVIASKQKHAQEQIEQMLEQFAARCQKEGIACRLEEEQGAPVKRIVELSLYFDLVVMGLRTHYRFETKESMETSVDEVLDHTITPVLAVPSEFKAIRNVVVAFDGTLPAARALQRFAHLADLPDYEVTLLNSSDDQEKSMAILNRAADYLRAYGAQSLHLEWTDEKIEDVIESRFLDLCDMVVLGVNGKPGLIEFVLGSLPKKLIDFGKIPLWLAQ